LLRGRLPGLGLLGHRAAGGEKDEKAWKNASHAATMPDAAPARHSEA
jgi:hypothetical protein